MTEKLVKKLRLPSLKKTENKLFGATGHDLRVLGIAKNVFTKLGELKFLVDFIVVENMIAPVVLGSNFLLSNSLVIDCENMVININCCAYQKS